MWGGPGKQTVYEGGVGETGFSNKMAPGEENNNYAINLVIAFIVIRVMMVVMIIY